MICPCCKKTIPDSARFCIYCSSPLIPGSAQPSTALPATGKTQRLQEQPQPRPAVPSGRWRQTLLMTALGLVILGMAVWIGVSLLTILIAAASMASLMHWQHNRRARRRAKALGVSRPGPALPPSNPARAGPVKHSSVGLVSHRISPRPRPVILVEQHIGGSGVCIISARVVERVVAPPWVVSDLSLEAVFVSFDEYERDA